MVLKLVKIYLTVVQLITFHNFSWGVRLPVFGTGIVLAEQVFALDIAFQQAETDAAIDPVVQNFTLSNVYGDILYLQSRPLGESKGLAGTLTVQIKRSLMAETYVDSLLVTPFALGDVITLLGYEIVDIRKK